MRMIVIVKVPEVTKKEEERRTHRQSRREGMLLRRVMDHYKN